MILQDARGFEGNSGETVLKLPVSFVGTQSQTVTGIVSAIPLTGTGFNPATGAAACGGAGVDFEQFSVPFSIPPNTSNGTLSVNIAICGDTTIEPDEHIFVFLSNVSGADCSLEGGCNGIGTIVNDDGPPGIQINNISASTVSGISKTVNFTVSLHHPSTLPVSVHFATRDGTAQARTIGSFSGDYIGKSGTLTIQPNTLSSNISVTILGTGGGTFFMDLIQPVNGTIVDGTGQCTIRIITLTINTGTADLSPEEARISTDELVNYSVTWTVPEGRVWRDLNTIDLRFRQGQKTALLVHWDEAANTFSLCEGNRKGAKSDESLDCTAGALPGSGEVLQTESAQLYLAGTSVVGSGPTGRTVTLNLALKFRESAAGPWYNIDLAGSDDSGHQDDFVEGGKLKVEKAGAP
jgi:hypothetical protein